MSTNGNLKEIHFDFSAWEQCPVCGGEIMLPNGKINWLETDFWYVICPACNLKFMNPMPTRQAYEDFYKNQFWQQKIRNLGFKEQGQVWQAGRYKWHNDEEWDPEFGRKNISDKLSNLRIETITECLRENIKLNNQTQILEVGCGFPVTLKSLKGNFHCQVYAIEPSAEAREIIEADGDIKLMGYYAEELEDLSANDLKFDALIFSHVLENTTDPLSVIKFAKNCLKEQGIIYVQTPNLLVCDQMNPYHPYIFCNQSLQVLADKAGLKYQPVSQRIERMLTAVCLKQG